MKKNAAKKLMMTFIVFLVVLILFSNLGQNFKYDIFSAGIAVMHSERMNNDWNLSKSYEDYIGTEASHIAAVLKDNNIEPLSNNGYICKWDTNIPSLQYASSLEVVTRYGRIIKKYQYSKDYTEDYRGDIKSGVIIGKAGYTKQTDITSSSSAQILLFDGYKGKSAEDIKRTDEELLSKGVCCVLSPSYSNDICSESGLYNGIFYTSASGKGLIKLVTSMGTFEELKKYVKNGYSLKVKSGSQIKKSSLENVYGILKGKNPSYKPLIIVSCFDGEYKFDSSEKEQNYIKYTAAPAVALECIRSLKLQRLHRPDRTIIFAFVSGYPHNKDGLNEFLGSNIDGNAIILDGFGTDNRLLLSYYKPERYFIENLEHIAGRNNMNIISKNNFTGMKANSVYLSVINNNIENLNYEIVNNSGRFLMSVIGEDCYDLDFLSGSIPEVRAFKQIVREHTILISIVTLTLLIIIIFRYHE